MPGEEVAHGVHQARLRYGDLCGAGFAPLLGVLDGGGGLGAFDQVLDLHLALGALVAALDDDAGGPALVGVFHLRLHAGGTQVHLGADAGLAQRLRHLLVAWQLGLIHDEDDHGTARGGGIGLADGRERRLQARDADGEAGGRHLGPRETLDEAVIAAAAADRAEADGLAGFVLHLGGDLGFEDGAGVVLEATNDGYVGADPVISITRRADETAYRP